jgi:NAD(P)-dependent dehydrogenase (short-subunit alcohol dehydrogenase family)
VALITGGDSGIGRAVAVLFAREGADVAIGHLAEEDTDANQTVKLVEAEGRRCLTLSGDVGDEAFCQDAVAPGPIWTPLIPATMPEEKVASFGKDVPMGRPGQPEEVASCYLFLASDDSSYMAGQVLHPNGGNVING